MRDTQREAETQAEGEAGSLWGAWCGSWSQDPRIATWAEGRCLTIEPPGALMIVLWLKWKCGDPWVAQQFSACLWPRVWSWSPGIESHIGLPAWSLLLPLPVPILLSLSLSLCLSWINKWNLKKKRKLHTWIQTPPQKKSQKKLVTNWIEKQIK